MLKVHLAYLPIFFPFEPKYLIIINMLKLNNFPKKTSTKSYFYRYFVNQVSLLSMRSPPFARKSGCLHIYLYFRFVFYLISNQIFMYINHKDTC